MIGIKCCFYWSRWGSRIWLAIICVATVVVCYYLNIIPALTVAMEDETVKFDLITCNCSHKSLMQVEPSKPNNTVIDIIISIDERTIPAFTVLMNSILRHTKSTVFFHILVTGLHPQDVNKHIECFQLPPHLREIVVFNSSLLYDAFGDSYDRYKTFGVESKSSFMHTDSMYARLVFHRIFPSLSVALYMDVDIVVQGDIQELWDKSYVLIHNYIISGVARHHKMRGRSHYGWYFNSEVQNIFKNRYLKPMKTSKSTFINGLYMENLDRWRQQEERINKELRFWMDKNSEHHWWTLGSITLTFLVFYDDWITTVGSEWHLESLGHKNVMSFFDTQMAKLIHFNGRAKPWLDNKKEKYANLWIRQKPLMCTEEELI